MQVKLDIVRQLPTIGFCLANPSEGCDSQWLAMALVALNVLLVFVQLVWAKGTMGILATGLVTTVITILTVTVFRWWLPYTVY